MGYGDSKEALIMAEQFQIGDKVKIIDFHNEQVYTIVQKKNHSGREIYRLEGHFAWKIAANLKRVSS